MGFGVETNDISVYRWRFTSIRGLIKEVYRENTFSFCGWVGKDITNRPLVFLWSGVSSGLATYLTVARNRGKRLWSKWFSRKDFNGRLKESFRKNCILLNKSMHSIYFFADINECEALTHHCSSNAFCNNTKGSYICTCEPGYTGKGVNCTGKIRKPKHSADSNNLIGKHFYSINIFEFH